MVNMVGIYACNRDKEIRCPYKVEYSKRCKELLKDGAINSSSYAMSLNYLKNTRGNDIAVVARDENGYLYMARQQACLKCSSMGEIVNPS